MSPCNGVRVSPCGISVASPAAHTSGAEVVIRSSTMIPPVEPILIPAASARALFGVLCVEITTRSAAISPPEVLTARTLPPSPRNSSKVVLKCRCTPSSRQDSSTGAMMSGSAIIDNAYGFGSIRCVSTPRCASAVTISNPSGPASTTTADLVAEMTLSHSIALRMFLT